MIEPISIILVDDHEFVRNGLRGYLETLPEFNVIAEAASGEDALTLAAEHIPDVVPMDLIMPGMDGVETTRRVKKINPRTQVVVLNPDCLNTAWFWRNIPKLRVKFALMFNIFIKQTTNGVLGIPMKLMDETSRSFTVFQTLAAFFVFFNRNAANLFEQIILTVDHEQGLKLTKVTEFFGGSASTDTALVATETIEKTFEF